LLSFAQFEREVTGERIRDKIAASKKKGMWMGGMPPIGYRVNDRKLIIKEEEASIVRHIFRRYAELRSVARLYKELQQQGYRTKLFTSASGWSTGGKHFSRGHLYRILQNRIYLGEVVHQEQSYPGEHEAIIGADLWNQVEQVFAANRRGEMNGRHSPSGALLKGLIFDDAGNRMSPIHANKRGRRYRYYVSWALLQHRKEAGGSLARVPAHELEKLVAERTLEVLAADSRMKAVVARCPDEEDRDRFDLFRKVLKRVEVLGGSGSHPL
jgi:site-specific DNA recombinase